MKSYKFQVSNIREWFLHKSDSDQVLLGRNHVTDLVMLVGRIRPR